jgi:hypothetical protein
MIKTSPKADEQIKAGYKLLVMRDLPDKKLRVLMDLYQKALKNYDGNEEAIFKLTADKSNKPHLAAMTIVANAMLNLDEVLTKE